jgi:hypothetical protein
MTTILLLFVFVVENRALFSRINYFFLIFLLSCFRTTVRIVTHFWSSLCFICFATQENQCRCGSLGDKIVGDCCSSPAVPRASRLLHSISPTDVVQWVLCSHYHRVLWSHSSLRASLPLRKRCTICVSESPAGNTL